MMVRGVEDAIEEPAVECANQDGESHVDEERPEMEDGGEWGGRDEVGEYKGWYEALEAEFGY